jgi:glucokinase
MTNLRRKAFVLAGDIGGTKTNMGLFQMGKTRPILQSLAAYSSRESKGLEDIIEQFLGTYPTDVEDACFGIAGPVLNGHCRTTNLPWDVSEYGIKRRFNWRRVSLINDLAAAAYAIPSLNSREVFSLSRARSRKGQNIALMAPGTGLGQAFLVFKDGDYTPVSSEGGHGDFAPNTSSEAQLWKYLRKRFGHVSVERVISGPGLMNIYAWLKSSGKYSEPSWLTEQIKKEDPSKAITEAAMKNKVHLCVKTLNMFVSVFGSAAGNLALTGTATGGVYLGGGIPPKILPALKGDIFMNAFCAKGRFTDMLSDISVKVILNDRAALLGAASYAFRMMKS